MFSTLILAGNLGKAPEMRFTPAGKPVTSFSVAVSHQYTGANGQQVKETTWFKVVTWGKQAEVCNQYLEKGSKVLVEGRLSIDPATGGPKIWNAQDGSPRANFEVQASVVRFLSAKNGAPAEHQADPSDQGQAAGAAPEDDFLF